ncbi:hypothetical protein L195_g010921 [Trifolium pratense]|uniref:Uncharacterized protein n=1 Tax=Trifolium pratense TaxID=57577 RepID=A0A2K3PG74_TRIPR|nr:hypothetical protein L195_g010921 [Trifolium pratense]
MKGFGSYNDWPYYASPSSNLSAFATPFSVNRPSPIDVSAPFIDPADAVRPSLPYGYLNPIKESDSDDSNSSNQFGYSGFHVLDSSCAQLPQFSNANATIEPQQYFNSYGLHPDHNSKSVVPDHWSSFSGFTSSDGAGASRADYGNKPIELGFAGQSVVGNQFADFGNGKGNQIGVRSSLASNQTNFIGSVVDERINLGGQDITDSQGEDAHMFGWEIHPPTISAGHLDDKSCRGRTTKPMPVDFSHTSVLQSPSLSLETHHEAPLKLAVDSGNHHFSYTGVYDKYPWQWQQAKIPRVDTVSSTPITGPVTDLNIGHNYYDIKEAHPTPSLGTAGCFGLGQLRMHLDRNEPSSSDIAMISDNARHEFPNPHPNLGNLSLRLNAMQAVNSVDKSFECGGDQCNPSVDSPCWKGAPTAHFSYYESAEVLPPEHVPKNEECFGYVIQEPQNFIFDAKSNVKKPCDTSFQMHIRTVNQETNSAGSPRKLSETRFASEDCQSDGAVSDGPFQSEPCDYGLQYQDGITKMKETSVPPTKPIDCEFGSSHDEHQVTEENKLVSQQLHTLCIGDVDAGCNENICSASGTPHTGGHALSSSSVEDAPTTPVKSATKVSTEKLNIQMLVATMQNLSQLLLNHCSNDAYELEEGDCKILRNVIGNLNTCILKNAEQINLAQECLFHQPETSICAGESCELQQGPESSMDGLENLLAQKADLCFGSGKPHWMPSDSISPSSGGAEMTKAENVKTDERENLLAQKEDLYFGSGKPHWMLSDSISPSNGANMTKAENMTKAIKNILSENFDDGNDDGGATESQTALFKNLWLEAEAALCSVSFKARYNQMKIEMEKHSYKQRDMEDHSKSEVIPSLSRSQSSAIGVNKCSNSDSSAENLVVLDATNPKELSQLKFSADMNGPNPLTPEAEDSQNLYSFIRNYAVSGTNKEVVGNNVASVMARYNVIKARDENSCINNNDWKTPSELADKLTPREIDNQNQFNFCKDSPIPAKNKADYETSVLARFHILKSRAAEDSNSECSTEKLFELSAEGIEDTIITKDALKGESLDANLNSYTAVDKSIPKEIHLDLEDSEEIERCRTYEFQLPNYHSDGMASDWEHV